jgi:hypothetical protein
LQPSGNGKARIARESYLDAMPAEEQVKVLRQADKVGPLPDDADWLVAYAAQRAAAQSERSADRIEAAVASLEANVVRMPVEQKKNGLRVGSPSREMFAFALALLAFAVIALLVDRAPGNIPSLGLYAVALAIGVLASAIYSWAFAKRR